MSLRTPAEKLDELIGRVAGKKAGLPIDERGRINGIKVSDVAAHAHLRGWTTTRTFDSESETDLSGGLYIYRGKVKGEYHD